MADTSVIFSIIGKDNASGTFKKIGDAASAMFTGLAVGAGISFGKDAIQAASDLAETQSKVNVLFGQGAGAINTFAEGAAKSLGQSKQQALDAASTFAVFGKSAGLQGPQLSDFSMNLTSLATDMASFSNTSPQEAIDAIGAALRGEADPIEKYGVLLNEATIQQQALKMGLIKTTNQALTPQQKVLATQALIFDQTKSAQGDFARTSGGLANQQRIMAAEFENVKTKLGTGLMPIMKTFVDGLMKVIGFVQKNSGWLTPLAIGLGVIAGVIWLVTAAQTAWNIAMTLNPIGLIIVAVIALVAVFIYLWTHSAAFRNFFIGLWDHIWGFLKAIGAWFAGPFADFFVSGYHMIKDGATTAIHWVQDKFTAVVDWVGSLPGKIKSKASGMWDGIKDAFKGAINWIISGWNKLHFKMPSFDTHIPGIGVVGGFNLGLPQIPLLDVGGDVRRSGLAVIHAGERVVPAAQVRALPSNSGGQTTITFRGNTDSAFATAFMNLVRAGLIQVEVS